MLFRETLKDAHISEGRYPRTFFPIVFNRGAKHNQVRYRILNIDGAKWAILCYDSSANAWILSSHVCDIISELGESRACSTFFHIDLATIIFNWLEPSTRMALVCRNKLLFAKVSFYFLVKMGCC